MYKDINVVRQEFINFFQSKGHRIISSSSLIPKDDQTLLFTNSGMNQFKNIFLGIEKPLSKRVVTAQRCVRAGGKHNDLNNVGYTEQHLTFFEMLGNFSFGDYFKYETIQFAWELLTDANWFNLSKDKIWVTTHICDDESYNIWTKYIGVNQNHILKVGSDRNDFFGSDNFWQMGDIGPCGPCSEIFYDCGGVDEGEVLNNFNVYENKRYFEIWNLVFMQFDRQIDGKLLPLPIFSVDTGMGLERITAILQGVNSNYAIDVFKYLIADIYEIIKINKITECRSLYVIADHIRACVFLIQDGVLPSNEGRGYVLRRIIRRAIYHGKKLGIDGIFFYKLVSPLIKIMHPIVDTLYEKKDLIEKVVWDEEKLFKSTLKRGLTLLEKQLSKLKGTILDGEILFSLHSTHGFPLELAKDVCQEYNVQIDQIGFNRAMSEHKKNCVKKRFNQYEGYSDKISESKKLTIFVGYQDLLSQSKVVALFKDKKPINKITLKEEGIIILDKTPFYGESGGQIGDFGQLRTDSTVFQVLKTKRYGTTIAHIGIISSGSSIRIGEEVLAQVDETKRNYISSNHSATHLLHASLIKVLAGSNSSIIQKGSFISDKYLRFDFSCDKFIERTQINAIERLVNEQIWNNLFIKADIMTMDMAKNTGAVMLLQKRYNDENVRVLRIGDFSVELCAGTHVACTGEIGLFIITKEYNIGSGIKRIEAVTKDLAFSVMQTQKTLLQDVNKILRSNNKNLLSKIYMFNSCNKELRYDSKILNNKKKMEYEGSLIKDLHHIKNIRVLVKKVVNMEKKSLFIMMDDFRNQLGSGIVIFINLKKYNKTHLVVNVTKDLIEHGCINAVILVNHIASRFGGKGGGKFDLAQVGLDCIVTQSQLLVEINSLLNEQKTAYYMNNLPMNQDI